MEITDIKVVSKKSSRKFFKSIWIGVNKKERALSYLDTKKILRRAPKNIMKIRKYSKTITCVFVMNDEYFRIFHDEKILSVFDTLVEPHRIKKNNKSWVKYKAIMNIYDCEEDYEK